MSARDNILVRVRKALGRSGPLSDAETAAMRAKLRDHPRGPQPSMPWEPVSRFKERCAILSSTVDEAASLADVPQTVARYLSERDLPRAGVCWPELAGLGWHAAGLQMDGRPATGDDKTGITGSF